MYVLCVCVCVSRVVLFGGQQSKVFTLHGIVSQLLLFLDSLSAENWSLNGGSFLILTVNSAKFFLLN